MDLMLWRPKKDTHQLMGTGVCGIYNLNITQSNTKSDQPVEIQCHSKYSGMAQNVINTLNIDANFKGRKDGETLHPYCIECLCRVSEEMYAFTVGGDSDIYE